MVTIVLCNKDTQPSQACSEGYTFCRYVSSGVCTAPGLTNRPKLTNFLFDSGGFVGFSEPPPEGGLDLVTKLVSKAERPVRLCSLVLRKANFCSIRVR